MPSSVAATFQRSALLPMGTLLVSAAFVAIGLLLQGNTHLNHDLSWILYSSRQMLEGAVFGRDIIGSNPPLAWYLTLPAVMLSEALGIDPVSALRGFIATLTLGTLAFAYRLLRNQLPEDSRLSGGLFLVLASYYLFIGCYRDFAQREYLALAMSLPYILASSARMDGTKYTRKVAISVGLLAGIGLALKPYFLVVPLLIEIVGLIRMRSLRFSMRLENWALAAFIGLYGISLLIVTPDFIFNVVPLVSPIYWAFNNDPVAVLWQIGPELTGFLMAVYLAGKQRHSTVIPVLLAAGGGFLVAYFAQMKGYTYQGFPVRAIVAIVLALIIAEAFERKAGFESGSKTWPACLAGIALLVVLGSNLHAVVRWYDDTRRDGGPYAIVTDRLIDLVDRHAGDGYFLALSTHPYPIFPIAVYSSAKSASRSNSRFFLPAVARLRHGGIQADPEDLRFAEDRARSFLLHDLALKPRLILVAAQSWKHGIGDIDFDILEFYLEDPRAQALWQDYREIEPVAEFRVFLRREEGNTP